MSYYSMSTVHSFPEYKRGRGVKLTTYFHLVPVLEEIVELHLNSHIFLHGVYTENLIYE
jgi:hypothetical protein